MMPLAHRSQNVPFGSVFWMVLDAALQSPDTSKQALVHLSAERSRVNTWALSSRLFAGGRGGTRERVLPGRLLRHLGL